MEGNVAKALKELRQGSFVLIYDADGREEETDLVIASQFVTPEKIRMMRKDGGGLICVTVDSNTSAKIGLPYISDIIDHASSRFPVLAGLTPNDIPYGDKSSFGLSINHRRTYTGITDRDRAQTISRFAWFVEKAMVSDNGWAVEAFGKEFRSPGHVNLLNASSPLLKRRRGHTELSTAILTMASLTPTAAICEMMGDDGRALSKEDAKAYAREHNLVFLEGRQIVEAWEEWSR